MRHDRKGWYGGGAGHAGGAGRATRDGGVRGDAGRSARCTHRDLVGTAGRAYTRGDRPQPIVGFHCDDGPTRRARTAFPKPSPELSTGAQGTSGDCGKPGCIFTATGGLNPARGPWRLRRSCHASGKLRASRCVGYLVCTASRVPGRLSTAALLGKLPRLDLPGLASPPECAPGGFA